MHPLLLLKLLLLLMLANGAPIAVKDVLRRHLAYPVDGGTVLGDGRPLFGKSKTVRGLSVSLVATAIGSALLGLGWRIGLIISAVAMAGDLCSSLVKRRLNVAPSGRATGLDQIPESLLPLLAVRADLALAAWDILVVVGLFFVGEMLLSILFYRLHLRDHPY
ncbi:MAG TPA: CDP-archaeol synthase [Candidatus Acidoferrales bacterium]|jgi:CDP-2,3-bis-(O-geranylgeranyl)-sn-glycerol synthase|nr:CDP-archaeol synthase [Candidatus Acidoferrales bacterium]